MWFRNLYRKPSSLKAIYNMLCSPCHSSVSLSEAEQGCCQYVSTDPTTHHLIPYHNNVGILVMLSEVLLISSQTKLFWDYLREARSFYVLVDSFCYWSDNTVIVIGLDIGLADITEAASIRKHLGTRHDDVTLYLVV